MLLFWILHACAPGAPDEPELEVDADGDGSPSTEDCDDTDDAIFPGADEVCDGIDNDCNGTIDDALDFTTYFEDLDGDGYGNPDESTQLCEAVSGWVEDNTDCDDSRSFINTSSSEQCSGGIFDHDCDGDAGCYDSECIGAPGCIEDCTDGLDNDLDGLRDCHDDDCVSETSCIEACDDGVDNDVDGLTDCEDGDCVEDAYCIEDCTDGLDNDLDGLTDCRDDECFWIDGCDFVAGVIATVHAGEIAQYVQYRFEETHHDHTWTFSSSITNISGTVRMLPFGVSHWSTATTSTVCTWTLERAHIVSRRFIWSKTWPGFSWVTPTRSGFSLEPDCALTGSSFLPTPLVGGYSGAGPYLEAGPKWNDHSEQLPWYNAVLSTSWMNESTAPGPFTFNNTSIFRQLGRAGEVRGGHTYHGYPGPVASP